jgi:hypothetical protein
LADIVAEAFELLRTGPIPSVRAKIAPVELDVRRIVIKRFPYDVVFVSRLAYLWVIAFAHHSRRPGFWLKRLRD